MDLTKLVIIKSKITRKKILRIYFYKRFSCKKIKATQSLFFYNAYFTVNIFIQNSNREEVTEDR